MQIAKRLPVSVKLIETDYAPNEIESRLRKDVISFDWPRQSA